MENEKGVNLQTYEFNEMLTDLIQNSNLPVCIVSLSLQNALRQIENIYITTAKKEKENFEKGENVEDE